MPPAAPARKRNRKRKRRAAASSSSSSSSSSSENESPQVTTRPVPVPTRVVVQVDSSDSDSDSSSSSSSSGSESDSDAGGSVKSISGPTAVTTKPKQRQESRSPSPPSTAIPPFLPAPGTEGAQKQEELRARFRKFWMASIADGFRDDLEELHKEPNLSESRLGLLIDSLASGADVFMAGPSGGANRGFESASGANEMEIVLDETS